MTEVDIMNDLECCSKKNCNKCSRGGAVGCSDHLTRDAKNIIKMQKNSLENANETIERLSAEVKRFESAARLPAVDELFKLFNRIVEEAYHHGNGWVGEDDYGECVTHEERDNWKELISAMQDVQKKLNNSNQYTIVVDGDYPLFQKR